MTILTSVQSIASPALDAVALAVTQLGSEYAYVAMLVIVYLAVDARSGRVLGLALLGGYYLNQHAKALVDTQRPYVLHPELLRGGDAAVQTAPGAAFPSGHAQSAATFWGLAAMLGRRGWLVAVATLLTLAIGVTRIYLGVHWPVDVLGGTVLGLIVAALAWLVARRRRPLPGWAAATAWVVAPIALHLLAPMPDSGMLAGAFVGIATAPWLYRYEVHGAAGIRAGTAVLGLTFAIGWLLATEVALPEPFLDHALIEPLRYLLLTWAGVVLAPALLGGLQRRGRGRPA